MSLLIKVLVLVLIWPQLITTATLIPFKTFDDFGDINCEDEYARLDHFAIQLQQDPTATGVIIFYGGRTFRGRLPRRGDAVARAARIKPYLVKRRGVPESRVIVINGGYALEWKAQLWIVPPGATFPTPDPTVPLKEIKFRKGKANPRDFRCQI